MLCDSHAHLLDERLRDRAEEIVANLEREGLAFVVEISAGIDESHRAFAFADKHEKVFCTLGVHPHYSGEYSERGEEYENWVREVSSNKKVVAMGECGLDYHYPTRPSDSCQRVAFVGQIKLAHELGLPLVIHSRDAFDDTFAILKEYKEFLKSGVLMHCYSYGADEVRKVSAAFDAYFSFSGAFTYAKKSIDVEAVKEAMKAVPKDRLILETDCPYLAPVPVRGTVNEPKNVHYIAKAMGEILGIGFDEVAKLTLENTKRFYGIGVA